MVKEVTHDLKKLVRVAVVIQSTHLIKDQNCIKRNIVVKEDKYKTIYKRLDFA